jgi:hypothetical protein
MRFGYFTLLVALTISAVAEFYSIVGLTAIFSAAFWPIVIMGASLGIGKVTAAVWLKLNWDRASWTYKLYLVPAVAFLMVLTSMGIFGYLSKAHSDQGLVSGDAVAKVAIYDEKIKTAKDNIDANRKALKQMDEAVDQVMGRSQDEKGADKAVAIRRGQQKERARLLGEITAEQTTIAKLSEERAPFAAEFRKVESEVGPIKYIAALVYGDNPDANILEKAVRLVIILIVAVFDPLALVLILAAQQSIRWAREEYDRAAMGIVPPKAEDTRPFTKEEIAALDKDPELSFLDKHPYLLKPFKHFENTKPMPAPSAEPAQFVVTNSNPADNIPVVAEPDISVYEAEVTQEEHEIDENAPELKEAKIKWKSLNPDKTLKEQRLMLARGEIEELPWITLMREANNTFGSVFPIRPNRGDKFLKTDRIPSVLYKFNGDNWIEVDKALADDYTYDTAYVDHLISKIETGEYDPDLLSDNEREQVALRLSQNNTNT